METIHDVRRECGNPNAGDPTAGPFLIHKSFRFQGAWVRLMAVIFFIGSMLVTAIGVFSLVFPIAIVGMLGMVGSVFLFWQAPNIVDLTKVKGELHPTSKR